jgi:hypothetical protein
MASFADFKGAGHGFFEVVEIAALHTCPFEASAPHSTLPERSGRQLRSGKTCRFVFREIYHPGLVESGEFGRNA